jgi:hypothetical protein
MIHHPSVETRIQGICSGWSRRADSFDDSGLSTVRLLLFKSQYLGTPAWLLPVRDLRAFLKTRASSSVLSPSHASQWQRKRHFGSSSCETQVQPPRVSFPSFQCTKVLYFTYCVLFPSPCQACTWNRQEDENCQNGIHFPRISPPTGKSPYGAYITLPTDRQ